MTKLKTASHHWWPRCVSKHWADSNGFTNRIKPNGKSISTSPEGLGAITNAHHIKLHPKKDSSSPFDTSFEYEFDNADSNFPSIIEWLNSLDRAPLFNQSLKNRFIPQPYTKKTLDTLTECIVSLAVRSPQNRKGYASLIENVGGKTISHRAVEIGLNMMNKQPKIIESINNHDAKFAVLYSENKEFIYGDGFFTNVLGNVEAPLFPYMIVPVLPNISVIIVRPSSYKLEPKLSTIVLKDTEVEMCNHAIQIYSKKEIFYRSHEPTLSEDFKCEQHLKYACTDNPLNRLISNMPGISLV